MGRAQQIREAATKIAQGGDPRKVAGEAAQQALGELEDRLPGGLDPSDFAAARTRGFSTGTQIIQQTCSLEGASETLSQSSYQPGPHGAVHVITPMVIPKGRRAFWMMPVAFAAVLGILGYLVLLPLNDGGMSMALFGPHFWVILLALAGFMWWRLGMVMVPDGCQALISRFGKVEDQVGPGLVTLFNPWRQVSYIVNTTREYPFNAPIHQAPTKSGVQASVDLFLQFRIVDPRSFIFSLGAVQGFQDKLNNAISETTRSLIYEQQAAGIYDLVGENTARLLETLNQQFGPAVEFTHANITHAEPSSQEYRMDLAAPEMVRVAKEAYTYEYELQLKKEQNEGDLNKDLASLNETLSSIQADIAKYQAQMDTALERETNRATSMARQRFVEAESEANANAALLEAQALDIRAMSAARAPEILDYRYQQDLLARLEQVKDALPQIVQIGGREDGVDYLDIAQGLVGGGSQALFTAEELEQIRDRGGDIQKRIAERESDIADLLKPPEQPEVEEIAPDSENLPGAERMEEIRRSVGTPDAAEQPTEPDNAGPAGQRPTEPDNAGPAGQRPTEPDNAGRAGQRPTEPDNAGRAGERPGASRVETPPAPTPTEPAPAEDSSAGDDVPMSRAERIRRAAQQAGKAPQDPGATQGLDLGANPPPPPPAGGQHRLPGQPGNGGEQA